MWFSSSVDYRPLLLWQILRLRVLRLSDAVSLNFSGLPVQSNRIVCNRIVCLKCHGTQYQCTMAECIGALNVSTHLMLPLSNKGCNRGKT